MNWNIHKVGHPVQCLQAGPMGYKSEKLTSLWALGPEGCSEWWWRIKQQWKWRKPVWLKLWVIIVDMSYKDLTMCPKLSLNLGSSCLLSAAMQVHYHAWFTSLQMLAVAIVSIQEYNHYLLMFSFWVFILFVKMQLQAQQTDPPQQYPVH